VSAASLWGLGLLLGLRHALEPDHVAAVAALTTRTPSARDVVRVAASWGVGHAVVILAVGLALAVAGLRIPAGWHGYIDGLAGLLLVALGLDVLRRLRAVRAEVEESGAARALARQATRRALLMGGLHGLAGSAALVVAVAPLAGSPGGVLAYLGVFGAGTIGGMALCSLALSVPLRIGARRLAGLAGGLQVTIGASSVLIGLWLALRPFG
jgi:hypothetical protein